MSHRMRQFVTAVTTGLSVLIATGCEAHEIPLPGHPVDIDEGIEVTVEFDDVLNLSPRSAVMVNDVTVGEVVELEPDGWGAEATLVIQPDVELPANAVASIRQTSMLGEKYVALEPPLGERPRGQLEDGATIPLARSGRNPELEEVLSAIGFLLNGGGLSQIKIITTEINTALDGRQDEVRAVLGDVENLVTSLNRQKAQVIGAMESINHLSGTLNQERDALDRALASFGPAIQTLSSQHRQLVRMLRSIGRLGVVSTRVVNRVSDELLTDLAALQPTLRELNRVGPDLADSVGSLLTFPFMYDSDDIVHGDFGNVVAYASFDLDLLLKSAGVNALPDLLGLPGLDRIQVPGLGPLLGLLKPKQPTDGTRREVSR
jgi:phospholipid/cholesterol/gamma-HCH transport system substrate-binding protein